MRLGLLALAGLLSMLTPAGHADEQPPTPHQFTIRVTFDCFGCGTAASSAFVGEAIGGLLPDEPMTTGPMVGGTDYNEYTCVGVGMMYGRFVFANNEWDFWWQFHSPTELLVIGHDSRISIIGPAVLALDVGQPACGGPATGTMTGALGVFPYPGP